MCPPWKPYCVSWNPRRIHRRARRRAVRRAEVDRSGGIVIEHNGRAQRPGGQSILGADMLDLLAPFASREDAQVGPAQPPALFAAAGGGQARRLSSRHPHPPGVPSARRPRRQRARTSEDLPAVPGRRTSRDRGRPRPGAATGTEPATTRQRTRHRSMRGRVYAAPAYMPRLFTLDRNLPAHDARSSTDMEAQRRQSST